jgi:hypothetical protein
MQISNVSRGGALLKTRERLMTGAKIHFRFYVSGDEIRIAGFVLRSARTVPRTLPRYQTAVVFDRPFQVPEGRSAARTCAAQTAWIEPSSPAGISPLIDDPAALSSEGQTAALSLTILSYSICNTPSRVLYEMLSRNNW